MSFILSRLLGVKRTVLLVFIVLYVRTEVIVGTAGVVLIVDIASLGVRGHVLTWGCDAHQSCLAHMHSLRVNETNTHPTLKKTQRV